MLCRGLPHVHQEGLSEALQSTKASGSCCVAAGRARRSRAAQQQCVRMSASTSRWPQGVSAGGLVLLVCVSLLARRALAQWRPSYPYSQVDLEMEEGIYNYTDAVVLSIDYLRWDGYFLNTYTITPGAPALLAWNVPGICLL